MIIRGTGRLYLSGDIPRTNVYIIMRA